MFYIKIKCVKLVLSFLSFTQVTRNREVLSDLFKKSESLLWEGCSQNFAVHLPYFFARSNGTMISQLAKGVLFR